jgi:hypothetical protein
MTSTTVLNEFKNDSYIVGTFSVSITWGLICSFTSTTSFGGVSEVKLLFAVTFRLVTSSTLLIWILYSVPCRFANCFFLYFTYNCWFFIFLSNDLFIPFSSSFSGSFFSFLRRVIRSSIFSNNFVHWSWTLESSSSFVGTSYLFSGASFFDWNHI